MAVGAKIKEQKIGDTSPAFITAQAPSMPGQSRQFSTNKGCELPPVDSKKNTLS